MEQLHFFISYTHVDRPWAEWIAWQLEDAGYPCRLQAWDFLPGSNFVQEMDQATQAQRTLLVLSPEYLHSSFTKPEWQAAFAHDPTGERRKIVAVMVRECQPEGLLSQVVWINVIGLGEQEARQALLDGAKGERLKPLTPPPFPSAVEHSLQQEPGFPGATTSKTGLPAAPQPSSLESDPTLILAANQRIEKAFKQRPSQLTTRIWMQVVWTLMQNEEVLDPNQFIDPSFVRTVIQLARQGEPSLFDEISAVAEQGSISNLTITQQQGRRSDENQIRVVLYRDGTISLAFSGLHQSRETHAFSHFIIDEDVVSARLHQASSFVARWYDYQDPHRSYNPFCYNMGFYDLQFHRFGKTPSGQRNSFNISTQSRPNPFFVYETPRKLTRNELRSPDNLINHAIARTKLVFHE
jgi:hypothetical protein